jgi:hypothetical protein
MGGTPSKYAGEEKYIWDFGGETLRKYSLGRCRHRWENNIKI